MSVVAGYAIFIGAFLVGTLAFIWFERWYQHRAWLDADREARIWFKQKYGRDYSE